MVIGSIIGVSMMGVATAGMLHQFFSPKREVKKELTDVFETNKIETVIRNGEQVTVFKPKIISIKKKPYGWDVVVEVPKGYAIEKFLEKIPAMEQATASYIKAKHLRGRKIELKLGCIPLLERMDYDDSLVIPEQLSVPYHTPFGIKYLDFHDESTCHLVVAGATRMGKTVFLRLLFTHLTLSMGGKIIFYYMNNKVEDYYPLQDIPQIPEPSETIDQAINTLYWVKSMIQNRKNKLRKARDSVNVRQYNEKHPEDYIPPMFVVFDEYGRFADDSDESEELQSLVQEIAETAGYLDIHLVIATQRPDATTVLKPRIRANILTRICFQTADEANSKIVIHTGDAAHLGEIRGRSIILDGVHQLAQIPYISEDQTMELLHPFRRNEDHENESERCVNLDHVEEISSPIEGSVSPNRMPRSIPPVCDNQSNHEAVESEWVGFTSPTTKR